MLQKVSLGKQKVIAERERWMKINKYWLKQAVKDVEILQNINLGHQKTIEEKDKQIMQLNESIKDIC